MQNVKRPVDRDECTAILDALEAGSLRAAEPDGDGQWVVNHEVKEAILAVFRFSETVPLESGMFSFCDRDPCFRGGMFPEVSAWCRGGRRFVGVLMWRPTWW